MSPHDPADLRFQTLLETAPIAIIVVNTAGNIELVNRATEQLFDYAPSVLLGQPLAVLLPRRLEPVHHHYLARYFADPRVRPMGVGLDLVGVKADGSEFPLEIALSYITTQEGIKAIAFVTDISARRHAEATQAQLHAELATYAADLEERVQTRTHEIERRRAVAESLRDILTVLNANAPLTATLALIVAQAAKVLAVPAALLVERTAADTLTVVATSGLPVESSAAWQAYAGAESVTSAIERGLPLADADFATHAPQRDPLPLASGSGSRSLLAVPLEVEGTVYGALVLYHRTPHHFSEEEIELTVSFGQQAALAIANARLRQAVALNAVAEERSRLARDLHDSVTQTLFAASLTADVLPRLWERSPAKGQVQLETLRQLTRSALAEMRTLLYELRPQVLVRTPMHELLEQLGQALRGRAQVEMTVDAPQNLILPAEVQTALYRITQEAGNNIAKHAQAQHVTLRLESLTAPDGVRLTIADDGVGFDVSRTATTTLGLDIMRERAADSHTTLEIQSRAGAGTTITVQWRQNPYD